MSSDHFENLPVADLMDAYQFLHVGAITLPDPLSFLAHISFNEALAWEKSIYIFLVDDKIVRIGSSKGFLGRRMKQWSRDVTHALQKMNGLVAKKSNTPEWEARAWYELLTTYPVGEIFAREATMVQTSVGVFKTYMDEESVLINRHKPPLNRHKNR